MSNDNVNDSKIIEDVNILLGITSIVENTLVDSRTLIINGVHVFSDSTSDGVDEIVKSNIPVKLNKSFEFPCTDYEFMVVPTELSSCESSEFLVIIQQMIFSVSSFNDCLEFMSKSSISPLERLDVCLRIRYILSYHL